MVIRPARGLVLVRPVQTEDTLPGGRIFIPEKSREAFASHQVQIVAVGEPEICEDEDCERPHHLDEDYANRLYHTSRVPVNAWALVRPRSFIPAAPDGEKLYFCRQSDIMAVFRLESETQPRN